MAKRDYYDVLGVSRTAGDEEIHKAYRRLARKHHPDVSKAPDAAKRFAEATEAYDVLTDKEKRRQYDTFGHVGPAEAPGAGGERVRWSTRQGPGQRVNFEDIFGGMGGEGIDIEDLIGGFTGRRQRRPLKGEDIEYQLTLDFLQAVNGVTTAIQIQEPSGDGDFVTERIDVRIPPGVDTGSRVRVRGKGRPSPTGGPPGDLYIVTRVLEHPHFRRIGWDIYVDLPVTVGEAMLGAKAEIPTLDGRSLLTIPPGTSSGTRLRLKGKGVLNPKTKVRGDQYAAVKIVVPKDLSSRGRQLVEELGRTDAYDPRQGLW